MKHGFTFCICPDSMILQDYINELCSSYVEEHTWEKYTYWGDEELEPIFWNQLTIQNIFEKNNILIIRNAHNIAIDIWKALSSILNKQNSNTWPIFCFEGAWERKQPKIPNNIQNLPCFLFAKKHGWIWSCSGIELSNIKKYIQKQADKLNITFTPETLNILTQKLPFQAATIQNELKKLALYSSEKFITEQDINILTTISSFDIFTIIDYIQKNKLFELWKTLLIEESKNEEHLFYILAILRREAKKLWQLHVNECTISNTYDKTKKQLAMKIGSLNIIKLWDSIYSAEFSVKSGLKTPTQSLEILITELSSIFC